MPAALRSGQVWQKHCKKATRQRGGLVQAKFPVSLIGKLTSDLLYFDPGLRG